ncbi:MAG: hypothetical protein B0A82_14505 [Alkalinema sp. CACIAM 70d]|nr:MAG: hypothetical protein B0A82_14505 [Alkalinema sp. CACIAM 70d]
MPTELEEFQGEPNRDRQEKSCANGTSQPEVARSSLSKALCHPPPESSIPAPFAADAFPLTANQPPDSEPLGPPEKSATPLLPSLGHYIPQSSPVMADQVWALVLESLSY